MPMPRPTTTRRHVLALGALAAAGPACAGPLRALRERWAASAAEPALDADDPAVVATLPAGVRRIADQPYGGDPLQRYDVYVPPQARDAPVLLMVHGGGWKRGDKSGRGVVQHKMARWVPRGLVFVSANYRLLPDAAPVEQARDVARALAHVQQHATAWGGRGDRVVLIGHSAGAHLVALLAAQPALATAVGAQPWLGSVALDSAALDVTAIMQGRHFRLYDTAFGADPAAWRAASPTLQLAPGALPLLAVCSSRRAASCTQAEGFVDAARRVGARASVLSQDLTHGEINDRLGLPGAYTDGVEAFLAGLDPALAARLSPR